MLRIAAAAFLAAVTAGCSSAAARDHPTRHYAFGTHAAQALALSLRFDVMDVAGSTSHPQVTKQIVDRLPLGVRALIWVGNLDNTDCTPAYSTAQFKALVDTMAADAKVFGYYLSDEPHPARCASAAADIRARADYLHDHSSSQKAFIVVQDGYGRCGTHLGCEFSPLRPAETHVDLVGIDPYPCHYDSRRRPQPCDEGLIAARVAAATSHGVDVERIVPVFQTFGQEGRVGGSVYYRTPTAAELEEILATWSRLVPDPQLDASYTFGVQCSTTCPAPQALANHPELRAVIEEHNG